MRIPLILALLAGTSCSTLLGTKGETAAAAALISDEQENKIGQQFKSELEQKEKIKYIDDAQATSYVQGVAGRVIEPAKKDRPGVEWRVHVIDDPKTVNAFATPGGYLYVYSGLMLMAENEAELAGVLAHEAGHVVGRHSARQMVNAYGLSAIAQLALGENPGLLSKLAAGVTAQGVLLAHSRSDETEADEYGARYTATAGYDPRALVTFFQKMQRGEGQTPAVLAWLSSHPTTPDRIAHVQSYITRHNLAGRELGADRLAAIKQRLRR